MTDLPSKGSAPYVGSCWELYSEQLHKVENLAGRLLRERPHSAQDLWKLEIDLANLQIELQEATKRVNKAKEDAAARIAEIAARQSRGWKRQIQQLQQRISESEDHVGIYTQAHTISRQFGDAFAWLALGMDEGTILPLTENLVVPSTSAGLSLKGMLAVAEIHAAAGAGFPVIHDITNCLRVGDITFVLPGDEPITIEVKTHVIRTDGEVADLSVETYAPMGPERWETIHAQMAEQRVELTDSTDEGCVHKPFRPSARLARQLERMSRARLLQTVPSETVVSRQGQDYLVVRPELDAQMYNWDIVQELVAEAKANGYASRVVDDTFVYVATYSDSPMVYPWQTAFSLAYGETLRTDIEANFPRCSDIKQNYLWFTTTWSYFMGEAPPHVRPFFLYPIPFDLVIDMIWGRLAIMVYVNLGKLVEALQRSGLNASVPETDEEFRRMFLPVQARVNLPDGGRAEVQLGSLHRIAARMGFEFLTAQGFVECVFKMVATLGEAVKHKLQTNETPGTTADMPVGT